MEYFPEEKTRREITSRRLRWYTEETTALWNQRRRYREASGSVDMESERRQGQVETNVGKWSDAVDDRRDSVGQRSDAVDDRRDSFGKRRHFFKIRGRG